MKNKNVLSFIIVFLVNIEKRILIPSLRIIAVLPRAVKSSAKALFSPYFRSIKSLKDQKNEN